MAISSPCEVPTRSEYQLGGVPPPNSRTPQTGVPNAYTRFVLSRLYITSKHPEPPNQRPTNVVSFQAQRPSQLNQLKAFTSHRIQAQVTP